MRRYRFLKCLSGALAAAATLGGVAPALAQTPPAQPSLALDRFDPAPAGDRMFGTPSPFAAGRLTPHLMLLGEYAHNPLVLRTTRNDETTGTIGSIVGSQLFLHLNASLSLFNRFLINVDAPLAVFQAGDSPAGAAGGSMYSFASPSKVQFGDLRAGLRFRILGDYHDIFQLAVGGYVWFPTGPKNSFVTDGKVRGLPQLIVGGRHDRFVWSFAAGPEFRPGQTFANVNQGTMVKFGGGIGFLLGDDRHLQIGPEFNASVTATDVNRRTTNAEVLLDARYRIIDDLEIGLGAGPGLTSGIGTPDFRGLLMVAYTPEQKKAVPPPPDRDHDGIPDDKDACADEPGVPSADPKKNGCPLPKDTDKDGIIDEQDACPTEPGPTNADPKKNGCPPPKDTDGDGIPDVADACPAEPGVPHEDPKKNGCPKDTDDDGIPDTKDACPDIKGVATSDPATNGCPPDTDGDTIRDDKDACPNEKGKPDPDPKKNGCPEAVRVTEGEIIILQQVQFDTNKATIKKVSDQLLDQVASVLKEHPEITKIEIQGHTDDRGAPKLNAKLSQDRADAVRKAMITRGIAEGRLTAKGFGQDVPIADNKTDEGRQQNRRVQFKITEKVPKQPKQP